MLQDSLFCAFGQMIYIYVCFIPQNRGVGVWWGKVVCRWGVWGVYVCVLMCGVHGVVADG